MTNQTGKKRLKKLSHSETMAWFCIAFSILLLIGTSLFFLYNKHSPALSKLPTYSSHVASWLTARQNDLYSRLPQSKEKSRPLLSADNKNTLEPQVHFEFYNTLPSMPSSTLQTMPLALNDSPKQTTLAHVGQPSSSANKIGKPEELEQAFAAQFKLISSYGIQLATFRRLVAAKNYRQWLIKRGWQANMVKITNTNKKLYRVQLGPFSTKEHAAVAQQQLRQKGLNGMILTWER